MWIGKGLAFWGKCASLGKSSYINYFTIDICFEQPDFDPYRHNRSYVAKFEDLNIILSAAAFSIIYQ